MFNLKNNLLDLCVYCSIPGFHKKKCRKRPTIDPLALVLNTIKNSQLTRTNENKRERTRTNENEREQTRTNENEREQTRTNKNERERTRTNENKRERTRTNQNE